MKKRLIGSILALCLALSGCEGMLQGNYTWEASHPIEASPVDPQQVSADTYAALRRALIRLVEAGSEQGTIFVENYPQSKLDGDVSKAVADVCKNDPIAAYAVEDIQCQLGTSGSQAALSVKIQFLHDRTEIRKIKEVADNAAAWEAVESALIACDTGLVLLVEDFTDADFVQAVEDCALQNPQYVMEMPQVTVNLYPESGKTRVVEIKFAYQTSRDSLKSMQAQVEPIFTSAVLFVSGEGAQTEKFEQLYGLLMNRFEYKIETSITPTYHLLRHGIGDSRAFAAVYGAMCRQAGLECQIVSGTREGESWYWNIIQADGVYYHVDLLQSKELEEFTQRFDAQMEGYVWDFSAYPACVPPAEDVPEE